MLKSPKVRWAELVFPASIAARASILRKGRRKSKWGAKFRAHFVGKSAKKWAARLGNGERETLVHEAKGKAKIKAVTVVVKQNKTSLAEKRQKTIKAQQNKSKDIKKNSKAKAEALKKENLVEVAESPWMGKVIRVVAEGLHEGRVGKVTFVHRVQGSEPPEYRLQALD